MIYAGHTASLIIPILTDAGNPGSLAQGREGTSLFLTVSPLWICLAVMTVWEEGWHELRLEGWVGFA